MWPSNDDNCQFSANFCMDILRFVDLQGMGILGVLHVSHFAFCSYSAGSFDVDNQRSNPASCGSIGPDYSNSGYPTRRILDHDKGSQLGRNPLDHLTNLSTLREANICRFGIRNE